MKLLDEQRRRWDDLQVREGRRLRDAFVRDAAAARPSPRAALAQALAVLVFLLYLALGAWGAWAVWRGLHPFHLGLLVLGVIAVLTWIIAFPRPMPAPKGTVTPADAPELHRLVAEVADALNAPRAAYVTLDGAFNAFMAAPGVPPRPWLNLGLPILLSLEPQERVFIVAHEFAHAVNRDPHRGFWLASALRFLGNVHHLAMPSALWEPGSGVLGLFAVPFNLIMAGLANLVRGAAWGLVQLSGEDHQAAEFRADLLAAGVSGTAAAESALDKLHLQDLYDYSLHRHRHTPERPSAFAEFRHQMRLVPAERWQERREAQERQQLRLDASHPPTVHRMAVIAAHPEEARLHLDGERTRKLEEELARFVRAAERAAYDDYAERHGF